jgi:hypothetical protein
MTPLAWKLVFLSDGITSNSIICARRILVSRGLFRCVQTRAGMVDILDTIDRHGTIVWDLSATRLRIETFDKDTNMWTPKNTNVKRVSDAALLSWPVHIP